MLLPLADKLSEVEGPLKSQLNRTLFESIVAQIPDHWLESEEAFESPNRHREAYVEYLEHRLGVSQLFVEEANSARAHLI